MIKKSQLVELGLNDKQIKVYHALLELGPSTATEISREANIDRTTSYNILDSLVADGLVNRAGKTKVQKFVAENPDSLVVYIENKIKKNQESLKKAYDLLPELFSIYNEKEKPKVKYYDGAEKMKEAFEDTLTTRGEIWAYAVGGEAIKSVGEKYVTNYIRKRVEKNIKIKVIAPSDEGSIEIISKDREQLRESLIIPKEEYYFAVEIDIYDNKVLMVSWKENFAVLIESKEIADTHRNAFRIGWIGAKSEKNRRR